jgi:uncharacterized protein YndB with AHSA1/START domain
MGFTGKVMRCDPPRLLAFSWMESHGSHSEVTFELAPRAEQVLLTITHRKLEDRNALLSVSGGWDVHVAFSKTCSPTGSPAASGVHTQDASRNTRSVFPE